MANRKPSKKPVPDGEAPAENKPAAVNPSAQKMIETVMRDSDAPREAEPPIKPEDEDTLPLRPRKSARRRGESVAVAAGVCVFGGDGGKPLLNAFGLLKPRRDPASGDRRQGERSLRRGSSGTGR